MTTYQKRRKAIAWAQTEVHRQMGAAQAVGDDQEFDNLLDISEGLTEVMAHTEMMENFRSTMRSLVSY